MKYYRIKVLLATENGEGVTKTFWATNLKELGRNKLSFDIVKKDGSEWHGKGNGLKFFMGKFDDVLQVLEAEMNLKYGWLEVKDKMDKVAK